MSSPSSAPSAAPAPCLLRFQFSEGSVFQFSGTQGDKIVIESSLQSYPLNGHLFFLADNGCLDPGGGSWQLVSRHNYANLYDSVGIELPPLMDAIARERYLRLGVAQVKFVEGLLSLYSGPVMPNSRNSSAVLLSVPARAVFTHGWANVSPISGSASTNTLSGLNFPGTLNFVITISPTQIVLRLMRFNLQATANGNDLRFTGEGYATHTRGCSPSCDAHGVCGAAGCECECGWTGTNCDQAPSSYNAVEAALGYPSDIKLVGSGVGLGLISQGFVPFWGARPFNSSQYLAPSLVGGVVSPPFAGYKGLLFLSPPELPPVCVWGHNLYSGLEYTSPPPPPVVLCPTPLPPQGPANVNTLDLVSGCRPGWTGFDCQRCANSSVCVGDVSQTSSYSHQFGASSTCDVSFVYTTHTHHKSYYCNAADDLGGAFVVVECGVASANCTFGAYTLNNQQTQYVLNFGCRLQQCLFTAQSTAIRCETATCYCGPDCSELVSQLVDVITGPLEASCDGSQCRVDESHLPITLKGQCLTGNCLSPETSVNLLTPPVTSSLMPTFIALGSVGALLVCIACLCALLCLRRAIAVRKQHRHVVAHELTQMTTHGSKAPVSGRPLVGGLSFVDISLNIPKRTQFRRCKQFLRKENPSLQVLDGVSGECRSGELTAIMGASGAGKTSLLSVLAGLPSPRGSRLGGQVLVGGRPRGEWWRHVCSFVSQECVFLSTMTVFEAVMFSANLRLPAFYSRAEKEILVNQALDQLGILHIAHSRLGSPESGSKFTISGGERRRVAIAQELVPQPDILMLDEPTSGLDSFHAKTTVVLLHALTRNRGSTVVLSVHQPRQEVFALFDRLILMAGGRIVYQGSPAVLQTRLVPPPATTLADFLLDVLNTDEEERPSGGLAAQVQAARAQLRSSFSSDRSSLSPSFDHDAVMQDCKCGDSTCRGSECPHSLKNAAEDWDRWAKTQYRRGFVDEVPVLLGRASTNLWRAPGLLRLHLLLSLGLALFLGAAFNNVSSDLAGFQNRLGAIYFTMAIFCFSALSVLDVFVQERVLVTRELAAGYYHRPAFFFVKALVDLVPLRVIPATVFALLFSVLMGLRQDPVHLSIFVAAVIMTNVVAGSLCMAIAAVSSSVAAGTLFGSLFILVNSLFGGFLLNVNNTPAWLGWLRTLSFFSYGFEAMMVNELSGLDLLFNPSGLKGPSLKGDIYLRALNLDPDNVSFDLAVLAGFSAGYLCLGFGLLLWRGRSNTVRL